MKENKMGVYPVGKLLITMSLPMMLSMLIQALYNIVDSIFVARIGEDALTAVSLAFPVQTLMIAVATGTGVGINALISRRLGEKRQKDANQIAMNGLFLALVSWAAFALFGLLFSRPFFCLFTQNQTVIEMGTSYLSICCVVSFGMFFQITTERFLQATGNTFYNMIIQASGAIINMIFDPILIFGLFGAPKMGIRGAAIATVFGQVVSMTLGFLFNHFKNPEIHLELRGFRPAGRHIKEIYQIGVPAIVMQAIASFMTVGLNEILIHFSETAVSVLGVYFKLQSFVFMPVFGLTNGLIPILGYNYGAKKKERMVHAVRLAVLYAVIIMATGLLIFQLFPGTLLALFDAGPEMLKVGIPALRIISLCFVCAAVSIVYASVFQAMGISILSLMISIIRQIALLLPSALILAKWFGLPTMWLAFPIAEIVALILSITAYHRVYQTRIQTLES